jgi:hypothetical protein
VGHVASTGEQRILYKILVGKPEGKRPLGRPRGGRDQNGSYGHWLRGMEWIQLSLDRDRLRAVKFTGDM